MANRPQHRNRFQLRQVYLDVYLDPTLCCLWLINSQDNYIYITITPDGVLRREGGILPERACCAVSQSSFDSAHQIREIPYATR